MYTESGRPFIWIFVLVEKYWHIFPKKTPGASVWRAAWLHHCTSALSTQASGQHKRPATLCLSSSIVDCVEEVHNKHEHILDPEVHALTLVHVDEAVGVPLGQEALVVDLAVLDHLLGLDSEDVVTLGLRLL